MANNTIHVKVMPPDEYEKQAVVDKTASPSASQGSHRASYGKPRDRRVIPRK